MALEGGLLSGQDLKLALNQYTDELSARVRGKQNGVPTFFDHFYMRTVKQLQDLDSVLPLEESVASIPGAEGQQLRRAFNHIRLVVSRARKGRYVDHHSRKLEEDMGVPRHEVDSSVLIMSQGVQDCLQWKGKPLFKTAYDFSLYPMLIWNLKPRTIIELGSGTGASAAWMGDLMEMFDIEGEIISVDRNAPPMIHRKVRFIEGDIHEIEIILDKDTLEYAGHPWLLVEDAHVNVSGVLRYFHQFLAPGDYVIVEDSSGKQADIKSLLDAHAGSYKIDTYYTDFFGRNVNCAPDSILVRQ